MKIAKIKVSDLKIDSSLQPKSDPEWLRLADGALKAQVPVYFAAVPLILCVPFDLDYRPDVHPVGQQAIRAFVEMADRQEFQNLIVYPRGKWFMISDHYIELFAALEAKPDFLPCFIMGKRVTNSISPGDPPIAQNG